MVLFASLSLPLPSKLRRPLLKTISQPFQSKQFKVVMRCILAFILLLFVDAFNKLSAIDQESKLAESIVTGTPRSEIQGKKFYAQRNLYLCGFSLFLTLILNRTYSLVAELILTKDKLRAKGIDRFADSPSAIQIKKLKEEIKKKDEDISILKQQAKDLSEQYDSL